MKEVGVGKINISHEAVENYEKTALVETKTAFISS